MKTREFIKRVEELGWKLNPWSGKVLQFSKKNENLYVDTHKKNGLNTQHAKMSEIDLHLIVEYAKTPIEEREEEKKYHLHLIGMKDSLYGYFNLIEEKYMFYNKTGDRYHQTIFTEKEIKLLPNQPLIDTLVWEPVKKAPKKEGSK